MTARNPITSSDVERETRHAGRLVLDEIQRSEDLPAMLPPEQAFSAVMCVLEQALGASAARGLERSLPASVRKYVARCSAHDEDESERPASRGEFLRCVAEHLVIDQEQAEEIAQLVFHAVHRLMSVAEVEDIARELPEALQNLWRAGDARGAAVRGSRLD